MGYISSIKTAFLFFPILGFVFTLPYILYQYHKYGSIPVLRSMIVYSFILYLTNIYFLVILPLPPIEEVANYTFPEKQLIPFQFIVDFFRETDFVWNDISTYIPAIKNPAFYQVLYNFLMLIPFGIYFRYYFKKGFWNTAIFTFLLSLFFELTQLTGLYGIYPRGYRLFDVDDLIINTLGGCFGFLITPLFVNMLPSRERLDEIAYKKGETISFLRRFIAFSIDWFFVSLLLMITEFLFPQKMFDLIDLSFVLSIFLYFVLLPMFTNGYTLGKRFVNIQIICENGNKPRIYHYILRYFGLYFGFLQIPKYVMQLLRTLTMSDGIFLVFASSSILFLIALYCIFLYEIFTCIFKNKQLMYEKISHTKNKSIICIKE